MNREDIRDACVALTHLIEESIDHPYGPPADPSTVPAAKNACVELCGGDAAKAASLWELIKYDNAGYIPLVAATTLIRAAVADTTIPDVQAPDPS